MDKTKKSNVPLSHLDSKTVSRETLLTYKHLLEKWQKAINLVSRETLSQVETRHFEDSLQLLDFIPSTAKVHVDLGSGAGFPGLVIAIARPDLETTLVESDGRKCEFLKTVSRETESLVTVLQKRIENLSQNRHYDLITARALAPLSQLLAYSLPLCHEGTVCLFLKGRGYQEEVIEAQKTFTFDLEIHSSKTHLEGVIMIVKNLGRVDLLE